MDSKTLKTWLTESRGQTRTPRDAQHVAFLAIWPAVKASLADGWSMLRIWQTLKEKGRVKYGYKGFVYNIHKLRRAENALAGIRKDLAANPKAGAEPPPPAGQPPVERQEGGRGRRELPKVDLAKLDTTGRMPQYGYRQGQGPKEIW